MHASHSCSVVFNPCLSDEINNELEAKWALRHYELEIKKLEDHYRVATRISERDGNLSALLYINLKDGEECLNALEAVRDYQEELKNCISEEN